MDNETSRCRNDDLQYPAAAQEPEEKYTRELLSLTREINDVLLCYKNEMRRERIGLSTQTERLLLDMLETYEAISGYVRQFDGKGPDGFERIRTIQLDMGQKLERAGILPMTAERGDPYDELRHEIPDPASWSGDRRGRPVVRSMTAQGYLLKNKVLRRARVEVDWVPDEKA